MPQAPFPLQTSGVATAETLMQSINAFFNSVLSSHDGAERPGYATAGTFWRRTPSATLHEIYYYDGDADILFVTINPVANTMVMNPAVVGLGAEGFVPNNALSTTVAQGRIAFERDTDGRGFVQVRGRSSGSGEEGQVVFAHGVTLATLWRLIGTASELQMQTTGGSIRFRSDGDIDSFLWGRLGDQIVPPGTIGMFPFTAAPPGWLVLNGAVYARSIYARLWGAASARGRLVSDATWFAGNSGAFSTGDGSTTFRIPNLHSEFLRAQTTDTALIGQNFADEVKSHAHSFAGTAVASHVHLFTAVLGGFAQNYALNYGSVQVITALDGAVSATAGAGGFTPAGTIGATGGTETRPRGVWVLPCIKF